MTIPIAFLVGFWMYRWRVGRVVEASIIGVTLVLAAVIGGVWIPASPIAGWFTLSPNQVTVDVYKRQSSWG